MEWLKFLRGLDPKNTFEFQNPASVFSLDEAESKLRLKLPSQLRELLRETNGVAGEYGLGLLWPIERIVEDNDMFRRNLDFRPLYMSFDPLLFFGDAGNGDQFAFPINADGEIHRYDVFVWNHEDDSRSWIAPSLKTFLDWWCSGKISV